MKFLFFILLCTGATLYTQHNNKNTAAEQASNSLATISIGNNVPAEQQLAIAIANHNYTQVEQLCSMPGINVNSRIQLSDSYEIPLLAFALYCYKDSTDGKTIKLLLDKGADATQKFTYKGLQRTILLFGVDCQRKRRQSNESLIPQDVIDLIWQNATEKNPARLY